MATALSLRFTFFFINRRITRNTDGVCAGVFVLLVVDGIMFNFSFHDLNCALKENSLRQPGIFVSIHEALISIIKYG
jgi:hypothetical protein